MKQNERLKNIEDMESIFNDLELSVKNMKKSFKERKSLFPEFKKLMKYYESEQRQKDYDDINNGRLKPEGPHGVLSEDALYDFYQNQKELCLEMIKTINKFYSK